MRKTLRLKFIIVTILMCACFSSFSQKKEKIFKGMYVQWGYNKEWYTTSNIHFRLADGSNFMLHNAKAHDKPGMRSVIKNPLEVSIPQYNYRLGFYLNNKKTRSVEVNFDHIKYVVTNGQKVRVTGTIDNIAVDGDSIVNPTTFLNLEHTDGGNLLHINYVEQKTLLMKGDGSRPLINLIYKAGAGINIPRTDFTYRGQRLNNKFHIAGYNFSAEAGARVYPIKKLFLEFTGKTGYVRYINALINTPVQKGSRVAQGFGYFEMIATVGYDIRF